jgi:hypothetical protein
VVLISSYAEGEREGYLLLIDIWLLYDVQYGCLHPEEDQLSDRL